MRNVKQSCPKNALEEVQYFTHQNEYDTFYISQNTGSVNCVESTRQIKMRVRSYPWRDIGTKHIINQSITLLSTKRCEIENEKSSINHEYRVATEQSKGDDITTYDMENVDIDNIGQQQKINCHEGKYRVSHKSWYILTYNINSS